MRREALQLCFDQVSEAIFVLDPLRGLVIEANAAAGRLLGLTREQLRALPATALQPPGVRAIARVYDEIQNNGAWQGELPLRAGDGRVIRCDVSARLLDLGRRPGILAFVRECAERSRPEASPRASDLRFRQLANTLPALVWTASAEGEVDFANDQWYAYTGLERGHMDRRRWTSIIHPDDLEPCLAASREALESGSSWRVEARNRRADGRYRWFLMQAEPVRDEAGRATGWIGTGTDIDDLKRIEQERTRLLEREQALRLEAQAVTRSAQMAGRMKDEFLATLSHELRTPLNAILGWTQTLQGGNTSSQTVSRALSQIEKSAQAQSKLIDDLLNVSDIVAGRLRLEVQPMRLSPAIQAVVEALHPTLAAKAIRLHTAFDAAADVVLGDPVRIQQIVWNVLSNSVKFTPHGGRIELALRRVDSQAEISVTDSGHGINREFLPYVFDRFRQADASTRKRHGGLGLGLSIARYLTEMHGGSIEALSEGEGRGATFVVRLPGWGRYEETAPTPMGAAFRGSVAARRRDERLRGLRILTVDDDQSTREMLGEALRRAGAEVMVAGSARDALQLLPVFRPDVLVSDIGMPDEDGYDLLRSIRALPADRGGTIPAVALTGYAREEDRAATRRAGYQAVTPKPVNLEELIGILAAVAPMGRAAGA
jgi:PAS domain S-box-containing protein